MGLKFSEDGPEFPRDLVDALFDGSAIFLCGAGVSAPQLPGFEALVNQAYEKIGTPPSVSEHRSMKDGRYEEALGSLSRRLSDKNKMHSTVRALLHIENPNLSNHHTLLRLSRNLENRLGLITTNFDTLFERAIAEHESVEYARISSFSGQALPLPGSKDFHGVIHLHGRNEDALLNLSETPLVLTSAEYGDAYMRAGWAARFLFDLVRCKTLILVGYSASDAPVRYFLNILEADRGRFADLKQVYALDSFELEINQAADRWESLAVKPLAYRKESTKSRSHEALWRDLASLADLIEKPSLWRKEQLSHIFPTSPDSQSRSDLDTINWIFSGKSDVWATAINHISDARWFDLLRAEKILDDDTASWVLASWCSLNWEDRNRVDVAVNWHKNLGVTFGTQLEFRLRQFNSKNLTIKKIWHLIQRASQKPVRDRYQTIFLPKRITDPSIRTDNDLIAAVSFISPVVDIRNRSSYGISEKQTEAPKHLNEYLHIRLSVDDKHNCAEIVSALSQIPDNQDRVLQLATMQLRTAIEFAQEVELISDTYDSVDRSVPSVDDHPQNEFHEGVVYLAPLMSGLLPKMAEKSCEAARDWAEQWKRMPSQIGTRLWLSALRTSHIYDSDEALRHIVELSVDRFWSIKRELVLAIVSTAANADPTTINLLCARILKEGPTLYKNIIPHSHAQSDWRPRARAQNIWLRLAAIRSVTCLSPEAETAFSQLKAQYDYKDHYSEEDLFDSYSSGVHFVAGNASLIGEIVPAQRLKQAQQLQTSWDLNDQRSWTAYCGSDAPGALSVLVDGGFNSEDSNLWIDLLNTLSYPVTTDPQFDQKKEVSKLVFDGLANAPDDLIRNIFASLIDIFPAISDKEDAGLWWDRLWGYVESSSEDFEFDGGTDFIDRVINHPAGRLTGHLLSAIDKQKTKKKRITDENKVRLERLLNCENKAGWIARGQLMQDAGFIIYVAKNLASLLRSALTTAGEQSKVLRSVLLQHANLGPTNTKYFRNEIIKGAIESEATGELAPHVASKFMKPLFHQRATDSKESAISEKAVRETLREVSPSILDGAAHVFKVWTEPNGENAIPWSKMIKPVFDAIWPPEATYRNSYRSLELAQMAVRAGDEFPQALESIKPFLVPFEKNEHGLFFLSDSEIASQFPKQTLELIWILCGPSATAQFYDLGKIIDCLTTADPGLTIDRRIQWLEQRAIRYG